MRILTQQFQSAKTNKSKCQRHDHIESAQQKKNVSQEGKEIVQFAFELMKASSISFVNIDPGFDY